MIKLKLAIYYPNIFSNVLFISKLFSINLLSRASSVYSSLFILYSFLNLNTASSDSLLLIFFYLLHFDNNNYYNNFYSFLNIPK